MYEMFCLYYEYDNSFISGNDVIPMDLTTRLLCLYYICLFVLTLCDAKPKHPNEIQRKYVKVTYTPIWSNIVSSFEFLDISYVIVEHSIYDSTCYC